MKYINSITKIIVYKILKICYINYKKKHQIIMYKEIQQLFFSYQVLPYCFNIHFLKFNL